MHQDLFSVKYGDGAPEWATLDEDLPHVTGDVWSDAYLMSPAVQTAFDNFWNNTPAEDGVGIQDRFAQLWKHIAERYADNRTVIGYDILNEPFIGSDAQHVMPILLTAFAGVYAEETGVILSEEELGADRKSTRLNSSHVAISYAVFCLIKITYRLRSVCIF